MAFEDWFLAHVRVSNKEHKRITTDDKLTFFQQLATLVSSGTPLVEAIQLAAEQSQSTRMRAVLEEVAGRVAAGGSLHAVLGEYRHVFQDHWIELIGIGEVSGKMTMILCDLNSQIRESNEMRRKVTGAMIYPSVLLTVAVVVVTVMLWVVVPTFADMFEEMGAELPGITQFVMNASDFVKAYGVFILVGGVGRAVAFRQYVKTAAGRRRGGARSLASPAPGPSDPGWRARRFRPQTGADPRRWRSPAAGSAG